jgi:hypothetical protein
MNESIVAANDKQSAWGRIPIHDFLLWNAVTVGIYLAYWFYIICQKTNSNFKKIALWFGIIAFFNVASILFSNLFNIIPFFDYLQKIIDVIAWLIFIILSLHVRYLLIEYFHKDINIFLTLILGPFYLQYKINIFLGASSVAKEPATNPFLNNKLRNLFAPIFFLAWLPINIFLYFYCINETLFDYNLELGFLGIIGIFAINIFISYLGIILSWKLLADNRRSRWFDLIIIGLAVFGWAWNIYNIGSAPLFWKNIVLTLDMKSQAVIMQNAKSYADCSQLIAGIHLKDCANRIQKETGDAAGCQALALATEDGHYPVKPYWPDGGFVCSRIIEEKKDSTDSVQPEVLDRDADGLTNVEEQQIGTDPDLKDSDGDGFDDYTEYRGGYNPLGSGLAPVKDWTSCVSLDEQLSCEKYCESIGKVCQDAGQTSRGYLGWGTEAWLNETDCSSGVKGIGQLKCSQLTDGRGVRWKCYCITP